MSNQVYMAFGFAGALVAITIARFPALDASRIHAFLILYGLSALLASFAWGCYYFLYHGKVRRLNRMYEGWTVVLLLCQLYGVGMLLWATYVATVYVWISARGFSAARSESSIQFEPQWGAVVSVISSSLLPALSKTQITVTCLDQAMDDLHALGLGATQHHFYQAMLNQLHDVQSGLNRATARQRLLDFLAEEYAGPRQAAVDGIKLRRFFAQDPSAFYRVSLATNIELHRVLSAQAPGGKPQDGDGDGGTRWDAGGSRQTTRRDRRQRGPHRHSDKRRLDEAEVMFEHAKSLLAMHFVASADDLHAVTLFCNFEHACWLRPSLSKGRVTAAGPTDAVLAATHIFSFASYTGYKSMSQLALAYQAVLSTLEAAIEYEYWTLERWAPKLAAEMFRDTQRLRAILARDDPSPGTSQRQARAVTHTKTVYGKFWTGDELDGIRAATEKFRHLDAIHEGRDWQWLCPERPTKNMFAEQLKADVKAKKAQAMARAAEEEGPRRSWSWWNFLGGR